MPILHIFAVVCLLLSNSAQGSAKKDKGKDAEKKEHGSLRPDSNAADSYLSSANYVHQWINMPPLQGTNLLGQSQTMQAKQGVLDVVIFIASWCVPCQNMMDYFRDLERRYKDRNSRFIYVFSHDLQPDAQAFSRQYGVENGILASHSILKDYHNPELPTIYMGDRHGWLLTRFTKPGTEDLKKMDIILKYLTSF